MRLPSKPVLFCPFCILLNSRVCSISTHIDPVHILLYQIRTLLLQLGYLTLLILPYEDLYFSLIADTLSFHIQ